MGFLRVSKKIRVFYGWKPGFWHPGMKQCQMRIAGSSNLPAWMDILLGHPGKRLKVLGKKVFPPSMWYFKGFVTTQVTHNIKKSGILPPIIKWLLNITLEGIEVWRGVGEITGDTLPQHRKIPKKMKTKAIGVMPQIHLNKFKSKMP